MDCLSAAEKRLIICVSTQTGFVSFIKGANLDGFVADTGNEGCLEDVAVGGSGLGLAEEVVDALALTSGLGGGGGVPIGRSEHQTH